MEIANPAALYADTRTMAIDLFGSLTGEQLATTVPLNPEWTVKDVAAHVCGIVDDVLHGNIADLGSDAWTAAQVSKRSGMSLAAICDEWQGYGEQFGEMIAANPVIGIRVTGDLIIHVHDVQHALGYAPDRGDVPTRAAAYRYVASLQDRAMERMQLGVSIDFTDGETYPAPGAATSTIGLRCSSFDYLRSVTGRRSRRQVEALEWDDDPTTLLNEAWNTYGPLRQHDVSI